MMKKHIVLTAIPLVVALMSSNVAMADTHTLSAGYSQAKVQHFRNIRGVNLQYRYEWNSEWGVLGSLSFMKRNNGWNENYTLGQNTRTDIKYYSLLVGPTYRFNPIVSLYAVIGAAHSRVKGVTGWLESGDAAFSRNKTAFAYGAGVIINPVDYLSFNVGYEGTRVDASFDKKSNINGFNVGVGYRF